MKIGINCRTISDPGGTIAGIGHYTAGLTQALTHHFPEHEYVLFVDHDAEDASVLDQLEQLPHVSVVRFPFSEHKKYLPLVHSHWMVARMLKRHALDIYHEPANSLPLGYSGPSVVTVHDLAVFEHPEWFPDSQLLSRKILLPKTMDKVNRVIAVSQATAQQLEDTLGVAPDRVSVIPEGVDHLHEVAPAQREKPYVLYVGTIEPRKNLARLLQAFDQMLERHPHLQEMELVIAGKRGWKTEEFDAALEHMQHAANVQLLGYVSAEEKSALMRGAQVFVFPSLDEGFGLPPLEAASVGAAVLVSDRGALPEVVAPDMPMVDPEDVEAISDGMAMLLNDGQLREHVAKMGQEHSAAFTWERVARATMDVYNQVLKK